YLARSAPRHACAGCLHLRHAFPRLVGYLLVPAAARLTPPTRLRTPRRRSPGLDQPQPPGRDPADDAAGPRHARPLRGPRQAGRLGTPADAVGAAAAPYEGAGRRTPVRHAGAVDRRHRPVLLSPAALPALSGATARQA